MTPTPRLEIRGWRKLASRALDLLYPPICALCRENLSEGRALCDACDADLPRLAEPFCKSCGEPFPGEIDGPFACPNCSKLKFAFEFARPAMVRDERVLEIIHRLKYGREIHLAKDLKLWFPLDMIGLTVISPCGLLSLTVSTSLDKNE